MQRHYLLIQQPEKKKKMAVTSLRRKKIYHTRLNPSISGTLHMGNTDNGRGAQRLREKKEKASILVFLMSAK